MPNENDLISMGYSKHYDYTQYSHDNKINIIPESDFRKLTGDVFKIIADNLKQTYGPYGSIWTLTSTTAETSSTKDGYNAFRAMKFSDRNMHQVYLTIQDIIDRVNKNVGDGTTSCMLLADALFDSLQNACNTPEEKRMLNDVFDDIIKYINDPETCKLMTEKGYSHPLDRTAFRSVIKMASNNNEQLTDVITEALNPAFDENDIVTGIDNVTISAKVDSTMNTEFEIEKLPGDYRVRVLIGPDDARMLTNKQSMSVLLYDHNFSDVDFGSFIDAYKSTLQNVKGPELLPDGSLSFQPTKTTFEPVLVIVRELSDRIRNTIKGWLVNEARGNKIHQIYFAIIKGDFVKTVIEDFSAATGIKTITAESFSIDKSYFETKYEVSLYNYNTLCVYNCNKPEKYIDSIRISMEKDTDQSFVRRHIYMKRMKELSMDQSDTVINIISPNSLESKIVKDQIQDCIEVLNSAKINGYVPNLLHYGVRLLEEYISNNNDEFAIKIANLIIDSAKSLFNIIWKSKYTSESMQSVCPEISKEFYQSKDMSFDILTNSFKPMAELATSSQYDVEIITAALSIVRYLITSRGMIFDASLLEMSESGSYQL